MHHDGNNRIGKNLEWLKIFVEEIESREV